MTAEPTHRDRQPRAPLFEAVRAYAAREEVAAFHTPGHKQGHGTDPAFRDAVGAATLRMDLTELDELDDLHHPEGVIRDAQALAAAAFGAEATHFLINGATAGVQAMILAVCAPGDTLIVPRHARSAVTSGLILAGARAVPLWPVWDPALGLAHAVTPEAVAAALAAHPEARGVLVEHPSAAGTVSDLRRLAAVCHAHGKPLLVDEGHGAHLAFHPALPPSAMAAGADLAAQATHRTLGAPAQAGMLHRQGARVEANRVRTALQLVQSTSPSYVLMAGLDVARRQAAMDGVALLERAIALADDARARLNALAGLAVPGRAQGLPDGVFDLDPTRLAIGVAGLGLTGHQARERLVAAFGVCPDAATAHHVLVSVTAGTTARDLDRLVAGMAALSAAGGTPAEARPWPAVPPVARLSPREAFFARSEAVPLEAAEGRVCAQVVAPHPSGIPLLVPGELVTREALAAWNALGVAVPRTLVVVPG